MLRIAAVGDVHVGVDSVGHLRSGFAALADEADVLLLAGDLTKRGELAEGDVLAGELRDLPVPIVAVLGNHDHESDQQRVLAQRLLDVGVRVIEGSATVLEIGGVRLGIAGGKGFAGGVVGACATAFGERERKVFANASMLTAAASGRESGRCTAVAMGGRLCVVGAVTFGAISSPSVRTGSPFPSSGTRRSTN